MKDYSTFIFDSFAFDPNTGRIELNYSLDDDVQFTETLTLPNLEYSNIRVLEYSEALFALHLIGGISYYKTCIPKTIEIRSGALTEGQAQFWNTVYEKGLGEFCYRNQIDFRSLAKFPAEAEEAPLRPPAPDEREGTERRRNVLVPVGGGKDSVVTIEQLRQQNADVTLFRMGNHPLIEELAKTAKLPLMCIERQLSSVLFDLNEQGALNGHIPITAYLSCLTIVIAQLYDFDAVAMSNEHSANEGNVEYLGTEINHQWSKSEEFEQLFQSYVQEYIDPNVKYYSALRHLSELEIAGEFAKYPQYFGCTTSCNANWKILKTKGVGDAMNPSAASGSWCGKCPKCAFVFCVLAAHLPTDDLMKIFGKNLFADSELIPLYKQLLGLEGFKPFECVGTPEETKAALAMIAKRGELNDTAVMEMYRDHVTAHA